MKNPIQSIKEWMVLGNDEMQNDLYHLVYFIHPDYVANGSDTGVKSAIDAYLDLSLDTKSTVQRATLMKGLINIVIANRKTEEQWQKSKELGTAIEKQMKDEHPNHDDETFTNIMARFDERKDKWIAWCQQWEEMIWNDNFDFRMANWIFRDGPQTS